MGTYSAILSNVWEYILNKSSCNGKVLRPTTISKVYLLNPERSWSILVSLPVMKCSLQICVGCQASLLTAAVHLAHLPLSARGNLKNRSPSFFSMYFLQPNTQQFFTISPVYTCAKLSPPESVAVVLPVIIYYLTFLHTSIVKLPINVK